VYGFVLFQIGPGLGLAGEIGALYTTGIAIAAFGGQIVLSHIWLKVFAYGPAEWVWRGLTYGRGRKYGYTKRTDRAARCIHPSKFGYGHLTGDLFPLVAYKPVRSRRPNPDLTPQPSFPPKPVASSARV
jgi:hypothetical protein